MDQLNEWFNSGLGAMERLAVRIGSFFLYFNLVKVKQTVAIK